MPHKYVVCPFCLWNRPLKEYEGNLPWGEFDGDPADTPVIHIRAATPGPGRGHKEKGVGGFPLVERLSLAEALEDPAHAETAEAIRSRLVLIVRDYIKNGLIEIKELNI